ncbi:MAG: cytochrome c biogenesis protein ResB [Desulfomonile tiedjei]|nr:cytochrome c biogenesis protein ResB [Desulfomonile tiedjei]
MSKSKKSDPSSSGVGSLFLGLTSFFTSVRTTIGVLFLLAAASVVGTIIPQEVAAEQFQRGWSSFAYRLIVILDLNSMYRSWWFVLLLVVLALNLIGCLFNRVPMISGEWRGIGRKHSFSFDYPDAGAVDAVRASVTDRMTGLMRTSPQTTTVDHGVNLVWVRDRFQLFGFPLIHLGIVVILLGGVIGLFYGVKGHVQIKEGETKGSFTVTPSGETRPLPFQIAVDKFTLTRYSTGEPKEFRSDVRLLKNGNVALQGSILVNHPLTYEGISLYQADYRPVGLKDVTLVATDASGEETKLALRPEVPVQLAESPYQLRLLSPNPRPTGQSTVPEISVEEPGQKPKRISIVKKDQTLAKLGDKELRFAGYSLLYATGLQVGYDPGTPVVWAGCGSLLVGFVLALFTNHRGVVVEIRRTASGSSVHVSGRSKRLRKEFREKIELAIRDGMEKPQGR